MLALGMVFATSAVRNSLMSYTGYFAVIAAIMLVALVIFMLTVREKEWAYEMQQQAVALGIEEETQEQEEAEGGRKLSVDEVRSLILLLLSIVLWFFGYNAVTSKYSVYASNILHKDYNLTPDHRPGGGHRLLSAGRLHRPQGRPEKKTILAGVVMLTTAFTVAAFLNAESPTMLMNAMFALAGIAWATINVNSFPHGGGNVLRRRRGQIHRVLLHRLHGRPGGHAHAVRPADGPLRHARAVPPTPPCSRLWPSSPCCSSATATASAPSGAWRPWTKWRTDAGWLLLSFCWCC